MIEQTETDGIRILRLAHGKASALDLEFCRAIEAAAHSAAEDGVAGVVLTGTGTIFSAGVDLYRVVDGGADYVNEFLPALNDALHALFLLEAPLVAALNGHAIAGGCIMAAAADHRLMARGKGRIGVPELKVGVPFPLIALEILRFALPNEHLQEIVLFGRTYDGDAALARGLVDEVVDAATLDALALDRVRELAALPADCFALTKRELRAPALSRWSSRADLIDRAVLSRWDDEKTRARIAEYLEKTVGKKT